MKKIIFLISLILFLNGCVNTSNTASSDGGFKIITSFYPVYIHTINICRDIEGVRVANLTKPQSGCLHDYTISTNEMKALEKGNVLVINGLGSEAFLDKVVSGLPKLKIVEASKGMTAIKALGGETEYNPHLWVSVSNSITQVNNIAAQLGAIDPKHKEQYTANAKAYTDKLYALSDKMHKSLDNINHRDIVTFHEAFPYFAKEFNLNIVAVVEHEPGTEPSPKELAATIETVKQSNIRALFAEPQYPAKSAQMIAKETGAKVYTLDPVVTGGANGDYDAYIKTMEQNLKVLEEALQ